MGTLTTIQQIPCDSAWPIAVGVCAACAAFAYIMGKALS